MKRYGILDVVLCSLFIISILFYGCETGKGGPSEYPTINEALEMIKKAHIGYPPDEEDGFYDTCWYTIFLIDTCFEVVNMLFDPELIQYLGSDGTYTASFSEGGNDLTLTLTISWDDSRDMWHYTYIIDGTIPGEDSETIELDNFKLFEMYATEDGDQGEITFYSYEAPGFYLKVSWEIGDVHATFTLAYFEESASLFTFLVKETIPYYSEVDDTYYSDSGSWRLEEKGEEPVTVTGSWGKNPPALE